MTALSEPRPSEGKRLDQIKEFLTQFKDKSGAYKYVEEIDQMMSKKIQYLVVDYNDLVSHPEIESVFNTDPDEMLNVLGRDVLRRRHEAADHCWREGQPDSRGRIANYPA